jgi:hypothetical protein
VSGAKSSFNGPAFVDDRGRPLRLATQDVIVEQVGGRRPVARLGVMWLGFGLAALWAVVSFVRNPAAPTVGQLLGAIPFLFILMGMQRLMRPSRRLPVSALAARLAAYRRCGACGYDLRQIEPEADGCVVCGVCKRAWRRAGGSRESTI